jgi:hypothetical protein
MKPANGVDQHVQDQVLAGRDVNLVWGARLADALRQSASRFEVPLGQGQEFVSVCREGVVRPRPATFAVEFGANASFQDHQPIPHSLFRDVQGLGSVSEAAAARQLDERGDLVGGQRGERHRVSNQYNKYRYFVPRKQFISSWLSAVESTHRESASEMVLAGSARAVLATTSRQRSKRRVLTVEEQDV